MFNTKDRTKEEIDEMNLFQGIKIIDKDEEEFVLRVNHNQMK